MNSNRRLSIPVRALQHALDLKPGSQTVLDASAVSDEVSYPDGTVPATDTPIRVTVRRTPSAIEILEPEGFEGPPPGPRDATSPAAVVAAARVAREAAGECYDCGRPLHRGQPCRG
jgi:hypothetical protein